MIPLWSVENLILRLASLILASAVPAFAQAGASPWENAVNVLRNSFTGPIATGLSLVAIVVGGLTFAYGEGHSKRGLAGLIFGVGIAIGAVNFHVMAFSINQRMKLGRTADANARTSRVGVPTTQSHNRKGTGRSILTRPGAATMPQDRNWL